jgi:UDP-glucose 6-dehydrogenase
LAACFAAKDSLVTGVEAGPKKVDSINQDLTHIFEARLEETIQVGAGHLQATASIAGAGAASETSVDARALSSNSLRSAGYAI